MKPRCGAALFAAVLSLAPCAGRGQTPPSPAPAPSCADMPAATLATVAPVMPLAARDQGITGTVVVQVDLDAAGRVTAARVARSDSAFLNDAALAAARASTFRAATHACAAVPATYEFVVRFTTATVSTPAGSGTGIPALRYFLGTWSCETAARSATVRAVGFGAGRDAIVAQDAFVTALGDVYPLVETYVERGDRITVTEGGRYTYSGTSTGWSGDRIVFAGVDTTRGQPGIAEDVVYRRIDDDHYLHDIIAYPAGAPGVPASSERCVRLDPASMPTPSP